MAEEALKSLDDEQIKQLEERRESHE